MTQDKFTTAWIKLFSDTTVGTPRDRALAYGCLEYLESSYPSFVQAAVYAFEARVMNTLAAEAI